MYPMLPPEEERGPAFQPASPEQHRDALYEYAAELLERQLAPSEVRLKLLEHGVDAKAADVIVDDILLARSRALHQHCRNGPATAGGGDANATAHRNMVVGGLVFVIGAVITLLSFGSRGGVIAYGAILWGAIQFIRGLSQRNS